MKSDRSNRIRTAEGSSYQAYVLRGWREEGGSWRFRLQDVQTEEQLGFTSVKAMLLFLREAFRIEGGGEAQDDETG